LTGSQVTPISSPYFRREAVEDVGGPVTTFTQIAEEGKGKNTVTIIERGRQEPSSRALVIAGAGMRRKHSYDTGVGLLEDIEEVESVLEKDSVLNQAFLDEGVDEDYPEEHEVEDDMETLVEVDGELYKEKEVEIEVSDSEPPSDAESDAGPQDGCGVKRKRTIRVVIRSRAFI
jgi:hypothetical protein